jgi:hypothetical protein
MSTHESSPNGNTDHEHHVDEGSAPKRVRPFSDEELEAGIRSIDPDNADVYWYMGDDADPYGTGAGYSGSVGRVHFVRAPANGISIWFGDLPRDLEDALRANWSAGRIPPRHIHDERSLRRLISEQVAATAATLNALWVLCRDRATDQTCFNQSFAAWLVEPLSMHQSAADVEVLARVVGGLLDTPLASMNSLTSHK